MMHKSDLTLSELPLRLAERTSYNNVHVPMSLHNGLLQVI